MDRRTVVRTSLAGLMAAVIPMQLNGQGASREGTPPSGSANPTPEITENYKYALAARTWRDDIDRPTLRLASNVYWFDDAAIAEDTYFSWLADVPSNVDNEEYVFVRMLAQGEYRLPPSDGVPRFDLCGIRTSLDEDYAEGVFVFSLCGNLVSAHYTLVVNQEGGWESDADELIYQCLSRMQPFDGDVNQEALTGFLPSFDEASNFGMPALSSEQYVERYTEKP